MPQTNLKTHTATWAKFQVPSTLGPRTEANVITIGRVNTERYFFWPSIPRESDVDPRACDMTTGDKDDVLHLLDTEATSIGKVKTMIDILAYPH